MNQPTIDGYDGLTRIGKGGFSKVFQASQTKFGRLVAIKVLDVDGGSESDRGAFEREAQLMGRVSTHPNIVTVYDTAFTSEGQPCIVMELCSGGTIADRLKEHGQFSAQQVIDVGIAIAGALQASHDSGVLHRDIKPQNILITDFGQPALSDFGISAFDDDRPQTGDAGGFTLHYAAPEVIEGAIASATSDIYSLAATLYTAAAGQRPFATPGVKLRPGELASRVLREEPARLEEFGVPTALANAIHEALRKDPSRRPQTASEFQARLRSAMPAAARTVAPDPAAGDDDPTIDPGEPGLFDGHDDDSNDRTVIRRDDRTAVPTPAEPAEAALPEEASPVSPARRYLAFALPLLMLAVGIGGYLAFGGGDESPDPEDPPTTTIADTGDNSIPAMPEVPRDVAAERLTPGEVTVSWESSDTDVTYEVRRTDGPDERLTTTEQQLVLTGVADVEQPCVAVMAVRGARTSQESDVVCASPAAIWVQPMPNECEVRSCTVRLQVSGLPADSRVQVTVSDPDGVDLNGFAPGAYETSAELDADGNLIEWRMTLGTQQPPGRYRIAIVDDVGVGAVGFLTVTADP